MAAAVAPADCSFQTPSEKRGRNKMGAARRVVPGGEETMPPPAHELQQEKASHSEVSPPAPELPQRPASSSSASQRRDAVEAFIRELRLDASAASMLRRAPPPVQDVVMKARYDQLQNPSRMVVLHIRHHSRDHLPGVTHGRSPASGSSVASQQPEEQQCHNELWPLLGHWQDQYDPGKQYEITIRTERDLTVETIWSSGERRTFPGIIRLKQGELSPAAVSAMAASQEEPLRQPLPAVRTLTPEEKQQRKSERQAEAQQRRAKAEAQRAAASADPALTASAPSEQLASPLTPSPPAAAEVKVDEAENPGGSGSGSQLHIVWGKPDIHWVLRPLPKDRELATKVHEILWLPAREDKRPFHWKRHPGSSGDGGNVVRRVPVHHAGTSGPRPSPSMKGSPEVECRHQ